MTMHVIFLWVRRTICIRNLWSSAY